MATVDKVVLALEDPSCFDGRPPHSAMRELGADFPNVFQTQLSVLDEDIQTVVAAIHGFFFFVFFSFVFFFCCFFFFFFFFFFFLGRGFMSCECTC
jgi:hypothetical protein